MADHTRNYGSSLPASTDRVGDFYAEVGQFKDDNKQRFTLDHYMDDVLTDGANNQDGRHRQVTMKEKSSVPSNLANTGIVYTKENGGVTELFYLDDSGNAVQITDSGELNISQGIRDFGNIVSGVAKVTGTTASAANTASYATQTASYPAGYTKDNCLVLMSTVYNTNLSGNEVIQGLTYASYASGTERIGGVIYLDASNINIRTTYYNNAQSFTIILGLLT